MGELRPIMRPSEIRQAVSEWAAMGFAVTVDMRAGVLTVTPPGPAAKGDPFNQVDFSR